MAFVDVPKDLSKVKNKVIFNLTKRQLIVLAPTVAIGLALYFLSRSVVGVTNAATLMVLSMLPGFILAMYEKNGMYLEDILKHVINVRYRRPGNRPYRTDLQKPSPLNRSGKRRRFLK